MKEETIKQHWNEVVEYFQIPSEIEEVTFNRIVDLYNNPNSHYHTLTHVSTLLQLIDEENVSIENRITLILAAIYHDAIYTSTSSKNEEESAKLLRSDFKKLNIESEIIDLAFQLILDTKTHQSTHFLSQLFLDMDLSILGVEIEAYLVYTKQVRKEFKCFPDLIYRIGRKKFIQKTLAQPFIFYNDNFRNKLEKKVIENLTNELKTL